jgi:predicted ATPase
VTQLQALGGLSLEPLGVRNTAFTRPKPLLLLVYLALEGTQQRNHLAELFWQEGNRMKSLSMALTLLRQGAGDVIDVDAKQVKSSVASDVRELLGALDKSDWEGAANLYAGAFLEGVVLEDWSSELEEWVYQTREYLAERVQYALLQLAEDAAKRQDFQTASHFAERAYKLPGLAGTEVVNLKRLYTLLCAGNSLLAPEVRKEAESYDLALQLTSEEARAFFKPETKPATTLPMRGTSFIGRDVELTELATLLNKPNVSLLTLLGTAGVGKTRLALQLALEQQKLAAFKDGVYFVPLESLEDSSLIAATLLGHLSLTQQGKTEPIEQLVNFFADKSVLLVLDNFEHLTAGAMVLSLLLSNCQNLKLLITSRETLRLEEEHVFALEGLSFPKTSSESALLSDAVQLFKERAKQVQPRFDLAQHLSDVVQICRLVEGLPLGIELAASWVKLMSCKEIASELEKGLELLSSTAKNIPERHRSLKAAFGYSWKLLTPKEQETLAKLAIFRGGFRREAASEVTGATIPVLASLVDKSLLRVLPNGRYDFHPLLHGYVTEKLAETNQQRSLQEHHGRHYLQFLERAGKYLREGRQEETLKRLGEETENVLLAWCWGTGLGLSEELLKARSAFINFFDERGRYREGDLWLSKTIRHFRTPVVENSMENSVEKRLVGYLLADQAWCNYALSELSEATKLAQESLSYLRLVDDLTGLGIALNTLACIKEDTGELEEAEGYYLEFLDIARAQRDNYRVAIALLNLSSLNIVLGHLLEAETYGYEALELSRKANDTTTMVAVMTNLGEIFRKTNRIGKATKIHEESLSMSRSMGLKTSEMYALMSLAEDYLVQEKMAQALEYAQQARALAEENGIKAVQTQASEFLEQLQTQNKPVIA